MGKSSKHSLKVQVFLLFAVSAFVVTILGGSYYFITSKILKNKEEIFVDKTIQQIVDNITMTTDNLNRYTTQISQSRYTQLFLQSQSDAERFEYSNILSEIIPTLTENNSDAINVSIVDLDGNILGVPRKYFSVIDTIEVQYDAFNVNTLKSAYTSRIYNTSTQSYYYACFMPILNSQKGSKENNKLGTCVIMSSLKNLSVILKQITLTSHASLMILDANNEVLVSNNTDEAVDKALIHDVDQLFIDKETVQTEGMASGQRCIIQYRQVPNTDWRVLSIVPLSEIYRELTPLFICSIVFFILIMSVLLIWCVRVLKGITYPIAKIAAFIEQGPYHNLHNRLALKEQNEIGVLEKNINLMLDEILQMTRKVMTTQSTMYETELARKQAELSALQSQINPHFLYNTLDCIKGYGYLLKSDEVVDITTSLSAIMRYCIKGPDMVLVKDEISCIQKYLNIISIRFGSRFTYSINIEPDIYMMPIPRFLLQPVVENAIYHGLEPKPAQGALDIQGYLSENQHIVFQIKDDGVGMKIEELAKLKHELENVSPLIVNSAYADRGIGLLNINNRIRIKYGESYGLTIESEENKHTVVIIEIPNSANKEGAPL
ncbi:MAG: sensor histidine kinase [Clostridiaceae bacterium]|nr:sensor histidine kinase [Clostridiaceae bacterium]